MKNVIIGTAGHIDHGKTTLIKALTGRNTDTLKEEIKRGISINLGFTYFDINENKRAGIVDVPGHERFIKNMIAGAYGIDIVLLTIAATDGVKPQTLEHADIISFLDIKEGLIVLTKSDLADEIMKELVIDDIREKLKDTFFDGKEIIMVDSISGYGLPELIKKIDELTEKVQTKNIAVPPRLNIDRVFTAKGFGAIVTGTLVEGKINIDDELNVYHSHKNRISKVKIRNIQIHEHNVKTAYAGQRTALNLAGIKAVELTRGDILAAEGSVICTQIADASFSMTKTTKISLKMWDRLRIYTGAREIFARFVPLEESEKDLVNPGISGFCQLRFEESVYIKKGDPFVIRRYSPMETIGGGKFLDPAPKKRHLAKEEDIYALEIKAKGTTTDIIEEFLKQSKADMSVKTLATLASCSEQDTKNILKALVDEKIAIDLSGFFFHINIVENYRVNIIEIIANYHNKFGLKPGISKEELRIKANLPLKTREFDKLLNMFSEDGTLKVFDNIVSLSSFSIEYSPEQKKIYDEIEKAFIEGRFTPPPKSQFVENKSKIASAIFDSMSPKILIRLDEQTFIHINYINEAKRLIQEHFVHSKTISLAEFRDMTKSSRKFCLIILEYFDNNRFTKRDGDFRVLC